MRKSKTGKFGYIESPIRDSRQESRNMGGKVRFDLSVKSFL